MASYGSQPYCTAHYLMVIEIVSRLKENILRLSTFINGCIAAIRNTSIFYTQKYGHTKIYCNRKTSVLVTISQIGVQEKLKTMKVNMQNIRKIILVQSVFLDKT